MPFFQGAVNECLAPLNGSIVVKPEEFPGGGEDVVPLLGAGSLAWSLGRHCAEEFARGVLPATVIPVVVSGRDKVLTDRVDNVRI